MKMEQLIGFGVFLVFVGFVIIFVSLLQGLKEPSAKTKVAIGGFIGFIPFGFGNDKNLLWFITILSMALFLIWLLMRLRITSG